MMKTGKNKRLLASILAASMLLAMSPFALAEGTEDTTNQTGQEQSQGQSTEVKTTDPGSGNEGSGTEQTCAAKIGETEYASVADAMKVAKPGDTIKLLKDITESVKVEVANGFDGELTIDLNTYSINGDTANRCIWRTGSTNCWPQKLIVKNGTLKNASGGAIQWKGDLEVTDCRFEKNQGGAILSGRDNLSGRGNTTIVNSTFEENQSGNAAGAAIQLTQNVGCTITGSNFSKNVTSTSKMGGAVYVDHGTLNITDCTFKGNSAGFGGAIAVADGVKLTIGNNTDCLDNNASYGGGIYAIMRSTATFEPGSALRGNSSNYGGAIYVDTSNINIAANSAVYNNTAANYGGAIYANASNINIAANSAVYNNTATTAGADLFFYNSTFTIPSAKDMSGDRILFPDKAEITGWYHDGWRKWDNDKDDYVQIGRWSTETADEYVDEYTPAENDTQTISLKAAHPLIKESSGGTDPIEWNVSRSKTATALDTNTWTSNVTLSLPSAEEALASDVVFVLDKSTSAKMEEQALKMLTALKEQTEKTKAKVKVGVVIFNKQANVTPLTDLATGYGTIENAIKQEIKSGTNTHAGLLAGKQMLDEDTEVAANRKYLIFVSDGISYMYDTDGKIVPYYWINDNAPFYSFDPYSWSFKYKNDNPPENWSTWVAQIGNTIAKETVTPILYADHSAAVANGTLNINDYKDVTGLAADQYTTCVDRALYYTYQTYAAAQAAGYNCYAVVNGRPTDYLWGPDFMRYLANGQTVDFGKIQNDILYAVSAGSTVEDQMGDAFDFVPGSLKLTVGGTELKSKADGNMTYFGNNAENLSETNYRFKVLYDPTADGFVWTINEHVSNFAPVQLTYTVKLTKPETDPGTYGVEDLKGEKNVSADKALFTNKRAVLNAINSAGAQLKPLDFPKPSVSYTVKKSSSGGGGGGGRKPTVTIPDDVPTGLNGDDHYAYIVGYPNGNVEPNGNITRAEVATIFFRLLTEEVRTANSTQSNSLSDVTRGQWFNHAVSTLSSMGIVKGHNDGTFAPNAPITRAEFAAIAARFDDKNTNTSSKFTDIASHWAKNEIGIAANKGWINGYPDGTFRPNQYITRAEAMTLVNRVLNRLPENSSDLLDSMVKWPDNSDASAWYYLAVQEATNSHYYKTKENKFEKWTELRETRDWTELEK